MRRSLAAARSALRRRYTRIVDEAGPPPGHLADGHPVMVDVGGKPATRRLAVAEACLELGEQASERLAVGSHKGDALKVAELAGIMAAKRTPELIPLCHPLPLSHASVTGSVEGSTVRFVASCSTTASTGVEMEALVAASTAALTLYDMLKAGGHDMQVTGVRLVRKEGGASGTWLRTPDS